MYRSFVVMANAINLLCWWWWRKKETNLISLLASSPIQSQLRWMDFISFFPRIRVLCVLCRLQLISIGRAVPWRILCGVRYALFCRSQLHSIIPYVWILASLLAAILLKQKVISQINGQIGSSSKNELHFIELVNFRCSRLSTKRLQIFMFNGEIVLNCS